MMFEDLQKLYESLQLYLSGRPYQYKLSKIQMEGWAETKAAKVENEAGSKSFEDI